MEEHQVEIQNKWNGTDWEERFLVWTGPEMKVLEHLSNPREVLRIVNDRGIYSAIYEDDNGIECSVPSFQFSKLLLTVEVMKGVSCPDEPFDLKQCHYLDSFNFGSIHNLSIDASNYPCASEIDLDSWQQFNNLKPQLTQFALKTAQSSDFNTNALLYCYQLTDLELPFHLGVGLDEFYYLERLTMPGISSVFTHQISSLPMLAEMNEIPSLYNNQFETLHAERYFEVLLELKKEVYSTHETRLETLLDAIQRDLPKKWTENGEILVLENELLGYAPGSARNDTLLHGRMKNGKRKGIWTVKFVDQYARNDWEAHHFNFSRKHKMKLTKNGAWQLKYVNKSTAIEGDFENGLKVGEWRFYNEDGSLRTQRFYENDTLKRSIVHVFIDGMPCESRTYYFSAEACVQSFVNGTKAFFAYVDMSSEPDPIIIDVHHFNILNDTKTGYRKIKKGTVEYESAVREHFVNYLYPELRQSVLPFSF